MTPAEVMAEAILTREWWDHEKAAHNFHLHDSGCAVCMGWVPAMVDEGLRGLDMAGMVVVSREDLQRLEADVRRLTSINRRMETHLSTAHDLCARSPLCVPEPAPSPGRTTEDG